MQIQPITNQPNFNGKLVFEQGVTNGLTNVKYGQLLRKIKDVATIVSAKPYDIFVMKDSQSGDFYRMAANKSIEAAKNIKEYSVKVKSNAMVDSFVSAALDAIDMYEKYISKNLKG